LNEKYTYNFNPEIIGLLRNIYKDRTTDILNSITTPTPLYTLRINTLKTDADEVLDLLKKEGLEFRKYEYKGLKFHEIIYYKIDSLRKEIKIYNKKIYVDKFTGESLCQGANLYRPGILKYEKFSENEILTAIAVINNLEIPVANLQTVIGSKEMRDMKKGLVAKNIEPIYQGISIHDLEVFKKGYVYDQSLPAILTSIILHPENDDFIIDMCAAPGGKTTHIAQLLKNKGQILAIDRSNKKIETIKNNLKRLDVKNVELLKMDSTKLEGYEADKILIDPPCSALGFRPKLADFTTKQDVLNFSRFQRQFINASMKNIKSKGYIVYSTCTLTLEENEWNIEYIIKKFGCKLVKQSIFIGHPGIKITKEDNMELCQRFSPVDHLTPGFFIAKLQVP